MSNNFSNMYNRNLKGLLISVSFVLVAILVSGCSNLTRFDFPIFGLDKEEDTTSSVRSESDYNANRVYPPLSDRERVNTGSNGYYTSMYGSEREYRSEVNRSELSAPAYNNDYEQNDRSSYSNDRGSSRKRYEGNRNTRQTDAIVVQPGDTLYSLARNNNVELHDLKRANGLEDNLIHVGQKLVLPVSSYAYNDYGHKKKARSNSYRRNTYENRRYDKRRYEPRRVARKKVRKRTAYNNDSYSRSRVYSQKVKPKRHSVVRPPEVVNKRRKNGSEQQSHSEEDSREQKKQKLAMLHKEEVEILRKPKQRAEAKNIIMPKTSGRFRWPAKGRIISRFGVKRNGARNDGVNLSVPLGTNVKAAESGVVAYAGNELKGYGNLVLIRHRNKWVTAYAHNSRIMVRRGQRVRRGQIIAKAGKSGSVSQPQLHFELRRGDKPVDPLKYM